MDLTGKLSCLIFYAFCFSFTLSAQEYTLDGYVKDGEQNVLSYVNIILIQPSDSSVVSGTSSDNAGKFYINDVKSGVYVLKATFVGYRSVEKPVEVNGNVNVGNIILEEVTESLEEVTVTSGKPLVERRNDRLVFNVENTSFSAQSSFDILRNTPGILVLNDQIVVRNTPATVYINDKKIYLSGEELKSLLENYSGSNIRSVEVITTPPARYDAESGAVVNIVTSRSISVGYKGSVNGRWTEAIFPKYSLGTDHYFKNNFLDLFVGYSYNPRKEYKHDNSYFNFFNGDITDDRLEVDFRRTTRSYAHNLHTILDFMLNKKNSLSITANIQHSPGKTYDNKVVTDIFDTEGNLESYFLTDSELDNDRSNLAFSMDYIYNFNDKGAKMSAVSNYIYYDDRQFQLLYTDYFDANSVPTESNYFDFLAKQRNNIFTQQLDFYLPSEWGQVETGLKYSSINSNSSAVFDGEDIPEDTENDRFKYDENIYAAYVGLNKEWENWSANMGLRGEYTDVEANSVVLGEVNTQTYFEVFPSIIFQYHLDENQWISVNYKRSINRPKYGSLNPYRYYLFENQYEEGNPNLTRSIGNKIALDYNNIKRNFTVSLYYTNSTGALKKLTFQNNENQVINKSEYNIDEELQYSLDFTYHANLTNWWYFYTYMSGFYMENNFKVPGNSDILQSTNTLAYYGQFYNQFKVTKRLNAILSLYYLSNYIYGPITYKNQFATNISVTRKFLKDKLIVGLNLTDVFNTDNVWYIANLGRQDNGYIARPETRTVSFSLKYNFGNYRLKDNERDTTPDEQERLGG